jgi:hypothetical protein
MLPREALRLVKDSVVDEGWKGKVAGAVMGAAALGGVGTAIHHSPMAHKDGHQIPMALASEAPAQAKLITDDDGKKIYVWTTSGHKGRPMQVYLPATK